MANTAQTTLSFDSLPAAVAELQAQLSKLEEKINEQPKTTGRIVNGVTLCDILDITEPTLIRYRNAGRIPYMSIGGAYRYDVQEVIDALKKGGRHE